MREHRTKAGGLMYYASRAELEALKGYKGNSRQGRACCPVHNGDNPTALAIDWETGWARCFACGDAWAIRVEDHPDAIRPWGDDTATPSQRPQNRPRATQPRRRGAEPVAHNLDVLRANLERAIAGAMDALPGSPGQRYLEARGIPLDVARSLGIGWGTAGTLAGRVIFPLSGPDGRATSATGRAADDRTKPKYKALPGDAGYRKSLFNGGVITQAQRTGHPLIIVEGPLDAAACVAAGLPLTVALCGAAYAHPEQFASLSTVILALDADAAGQEGRRRLWLDLTARGIDVLVLPASALAGAKDLGEYWQQHHTMPMQLVARAVGPHLHDTPAEPPQDLSIVTVGIRVAEDAWPTLPTLPTLEELHHLTAEATRCLAMAPENLPGDLKAEAEALAVELAADAGEALRFWAELHQREHLLTAEDRYAAYYAVELVVASLPI